MPVKFRKVFKTGNSTAISIPKEALEYLGFKEGMEVPVDLDHEKRQREIHWRDSHMVL
jgi:antitoxin component of MazEF toxin-antitoxin module